MDVGDSAPIKQHPYRVSPMKKELLDKEVQYMLKNDIIEGSKSNSSSPCILVPKHDGRFRFCTDLRKVNDKTKSDSFSIPRIGGCIDQISNAKFVSTFDMLKSTGTFNSASSRNFRVCNTKRFISVQGHAVWNEKCSSNIPMNG